MRKVGIGTFAALSCALAAAAAFADTFPSRPVRMVVPFAPGGASDFVGRVLQPKLTEALGQQVVVDNRAGASGNIGVETAAHAVPDGYTFLLGNVGTMAINPGVFPKFPVRPVRDFICVSTVVDVAGALAVHPSVPVSTLKEFIEHAKARPGKLNYGSSGAGAGQTLMMEYLKLKSGLDIVRITYKGGAGAATAALLAGEVDASLVTVASFVPFRKSGKVKVLAVVSNKRSATMPDVPTFAELGYPELKTGSWQAVYLPLHTPRPIVNKMYETTIKVLRDPWVIERLAAGGADIIESKSPEDCSQFMKVQNEFFGDLVKRVGVTAE
jgi:tripartite-type tricarboxylate transporter receptor subunit TctC